VLCRLTFGVSGMDARNCQTSTVAPAEPGVFPVVISVSGNWRLTFTFEGENAILVDYQDYH
jgi:hypothetical protein